MWLWRKFRCLTLYLIITQIAVSDRLEDDGSDKANTNYDAAWYNRLIQELDWADQMIHNKEKRNCSLDDFELIESTFPCDTEQQ
mgnify:CR=1 FL=1